MVPRISIHRSGAPLARPPRPARFLWQTATLWSALVAGTWSAFPASADVVTLNPTKDNMLIEDATGSFSAGAGSWFIAGKNNEGTSGKIRRALIQFDLSGIPTTATITAVSLTMNNDRGKAGTYNIICNEFCGIGHHIMVGKMIVE